jgi:hypothetical protein
MNREEILALEEQILADYQFTAIDKQLCLLAIFTHLNQEIAHLDTLLDTLADNWGNSEFLWRLHLEHLSKSVTTTLSGFMEFSTISKHTTSFTPSSAINRSPWLFTTAPTSL